MKSKTISPKIISCTWGEVQTESHTYKDAKLFPGGARKWDWSETGTHHSPGIQPADIEELLDHKAATIILSQGFNERLQTSKEAQEFLATRGCNYFILPTGQAVEKYNALRSSQPVGALIHSTC